MPTSPTGSDTEDHAAGDALASCIGDTGRFVREHWARAPLYRPGADGAAFADLFSLGDVDHILSSTTPRYPAFRMVREGRQLDRRSSTRSGRVGGQPVDDLADPGRLPLHPSAPPARGLDGGGRLGPPDRGCGPHHLGRCAAAHRHLGGGGRPVRRAAAAGFAAQLDPPSRLVLVRRLVQEGLLESVLG